MFGRYRYVRDSYGGPCRRETRWEHFKRWLDRRFVNPR